MPTIKEKINDFIEDVNYRIESYGVFDTFIERPFRAAVVSPVKKIIKILAWIPILWEDRDWDDSSVLYLLKYKIMRMRKEIANGYGAEDWKQERLAEMDATLSVVQKIIDGDFAKSERAEHAEKYGEINFRSEPTDNPKWRRGIISYSKIDPNDSEKAEQARQESFVISQVEELRETEAYNELFKLLAQNLRKWWD
jgi:hypothetical protein